jgi:hypothetical protein
MDIIVPMLWTVKHVIMKRKERRNKQKNGKLPHKLPQIYGRAVGWNYAERNRMDEQMRHMQEQNQHYQNLGWQQGHR